MMPQANNCAINCKVQLGRSDYMGTFSRSTKLTTNFTKHKKITNQIWNKIFIYILYLLSSFFLPLLLFVLSCPTFIPSLCPFLLSSNFSSLPLLFLQPSYFLPFFHSCSPSSLLSIPPSFSSILPFPFFLVFLISPSFFLSSLLLPYSFCSFLNGPIVLSTFYLCTLLLSCLSFFLVSLFSFHSWFHLPFLFHLSFIFFAGYVLSHTNMYCIHTLSSFVLLINIVIK